MLTISELTRLSDDLRRQGGETHWIVLDKECALSLRVAGDSAKFYFRTRSPRQVTRSLGGIDEISPMEAKQKALTLLLALEKGEALPESKTRKAGFAAVDGVHALTATPKFTGSKCLSKKPGGVNRGRLGISPLCLSRICRSSWQNFGKWVAPPPGVWRWRS